MTVNRTTPLPRGELRGKLLLVSSVVQTTTSVLQWYGGQGLRGHEGLVLWAGRQIADTFLVTTVVAPETIHRFDGVFVSPSSFGQASRTSKTNQLQILAQVHSHPGDDASHSDGDDKLILFPFEGMLSLVAPNFGREIVSVNDFEFHQLQSGCWTHCSRLSVQAGTHVVPSLLNCSPEVLND